jgi:hypothetical protein
MVAHAIPRLMRSLLPLALVRGICPAPIFTHDGPGAGVYTLDIRGIPDYFGTMRPYLSH